MKCAWSVLRSVIVKLALSALVATLPLGASARADGFRCPGGKLVRDGDRMFEVQNKCGQPDFVTQRQEQRKVKTKARQWVGDHEEEVSEEQVVEVTVDEWTYDLGPQRFIRYVDFENGRVVRVTTGPYGTLSQN
jgi:hypothetical protein